MRRPQSVPEYGDCIGTPSDPSCRLRPATFLLAVNEDTGQAVLLGLCPMHDDRRDEVQAFLVPAGYREAYAVSWRDLPAMLDDLQAVLAGSIVEAGSSWDGLAATG